MNTSLTLLHRHFRLPHSTHPSLKHGKRKSHHKFIHLKGSQMQTQRRSYHRLSATRPEGRPHPGRKAQFLLYLKIRTLKQKAASARCRTSRGSTKVPSPGTGTSAISKVWTSTVSCNKKDELHLFGHLKSTEPIIHQASSDRHKIFSYMPKIYVFGHLP